VRERWGRGGRSSPMRLLRLLGPAGGGRGRRRFDQPSARVWGTYDETSPVEEWARVKRAQAPPNASWSASRNSDRREKEKKKTPSPPQRRAPRQSRGPEPSRPPLTHGGRMAGLPPSLIQSPLPAGAAAGLAAACLASFLLNSSTDASPSSSRSNTFWVWTPDILIGGVAFLRSRSCRWSVVVGGARRDGWGGGQGGEEGWRGEGRLERKKTHSDEEPAIVSPLFMSPFPSARPNARPPHADRPGRFSSHPNRRRGYRPRHRPGRAACEGGILARGGDGGGSTRNEAHSITLIYSSLRCSRCLPRRPPPPAGPARATRARAPSLP